MGILPKELIPKELMEKLDNLDSFSEMAEDIKGLVDSLNRLVEIESLALELTMESRTSGGALSYDQQRRYMQIKARAEKARATA